MYLKFKATESLKRYCGFDETGAAFSATLDGCGIIVSEITGARLKEDFPENFFDLSKEDFEKGDKEINDKEKERSDAENLKEEKKLERRKKLKEEDLERKRKKSELERERNQGKFPEKPKR